jgi:hypothetical protein
MRERVKKYLKLLKGKRWQLVSARRILGTRPRVLAFCALGQHQLAPGGDARAEGSTALVRQVVRVL